MTRKNKMTQPTHPTTSSAAQPQSAAPQVPVTIDGAQLLAMLSQVLQSNAENASINKQLLEIEVAKRDAQAKKDTEALEKLERARKNSLDSLRQRRINRELKQKHCPHKDQKGGSAIYVISNHPDRQLRGWCSHCELYIEPEHVEVDANGKETIVPEHPLYQTVLQRDRELYGGFVELHSY
jgi:hypothetical protein